MLFLRWGHPLHHQTPANRGGKIGGPLLGCWERNSMGCHHPTTSPERTLMGAISSGLDPIEVDSACLSIRLLSIRSVVLIS